MKIQCGNCQKIMHGEDELKHVFPDIPDLLERISPGEPVPIGECPECGALVHAVEDLSALHCSLSRTSRRFEIEGTSGSASCRRRSVELGRSPRSVPDGSVCPRSPSRRRNGAPDP